MKNSGLYGKIKDFVIRTKLHTVIEPLYHIYLSMKYESPIVLDINGVKAEFLVDSPSETARLVGAGERDVIEDILNDIQPDDVFYDVGAHIGKYTCIIAASINANHVVAFEPNPYNFERLNENIENNEQEVLTYNIALMHQEDELELKIEKLEKGGNASVFFDNNTESVRTVQAKSGDEVVEDYQLPLPNILKIDVEGAEIKVLDGLEDTLSAGEVKTIYCEIHPKILMDNGESPDEVVNTLQRFGYEIEWLDGHEWFIKATK